MKRALLEPAIFASGISLFLLAHDQSLTSYNYLAPLPFWVLVGRPMGLFWNQQVLRELNRDVFPADLRNYRELYLVSRRAIAYDLLFNHTIYNPMQMLIIMVYTYSFRRVEEGVKGEGGQNVTFWELLKSSGLKLLQIRVLVSLASVLSEYWLSLLSLERGRQSLSLSNGSKRLLLVK